MAGIALSCFSRFLNTNYAPSSEERVEIESILHDPEERLRILDAEIAKLQAEREELRQHIDRHRMLLSPFRRLPADLWGEIFVQALPLNELNLPGRTMEDAPLLFTTVCQSWREIALRTPRLWNTIHIYLPRRSPRTQTLARALSLLRSREEGVKAWLDRSGSLPITFSIAIGPDARTPGPHHPDSLDPNSLEIDAGLASFLTLFAKYSCRWRAVRFSLEGSDVSPTFWQSFAGLTSDDLPLLQDVRVDGGVLFSHIQDAQGASATPTPFTQLLCQLPVIRRLRASGENTDDVLGLMLRWETVTDLHIASYNETDIPGFIARLVESCPSLSSLSLSLIPGLPPQQQPSYHDAITYLEWNFLRTLDIRFLEGYWHDMGDHFSETVAETFQRLRAPALEHLTLNVVRRGATHQSGYVGPTMPFHDMIVRSNSPITHLALDPYFFTNAEALSRTCESLPSLKSLKFSKESGYKWMDISEEVTDDVAALNAALLSFHPPANISSTLEKLDLPGSKIGHIESIIAFATAASTLKDLYVEFGIMRKESVTTVMLSQRIREALAYLREVKGTRVVWRWPNDCIDFSHLDRPYDGMKNPQPPSTYDSL